jgi:hypothetical protein
MSYFLYFKRVTRLAIIKVWLIINIYNKYNTDNQHRYESKYFHEKDLNKIGLPLKTIFELPYKGWSNTSSFVIDVCKSKKFDLV